MLQNDTIEHVSELIPAHLADAAASHTSLRKDTQQTLFVLACEVFWRHFLGVHCVDFTTRKDTDDMQWV